MERKTIFCPERIYRYTLWREWPAPTPNLLHTDDPHLAYYPGQHSQYCMFIGLNPSTADEVKDDATIRKCIGFAKRWGFGALCMTNIFAFRARDPKVMKKCLSPIGEDNDAWLKRCAAGAGRIIAAWGTHGEFMGRGDDVMAMIPHLECLRMTQHGHPEHPCYITYEVEPIPFNRALQ